MHQNNLRRFLIVLMAMALGIGFSDTTAHLSEQANPEATPQPGPVFAIQQVESSSTPYFSIELDPGDSAELQSVVRTVNSIPLSLRAYSTNAFTLVNGGIDAGTEEDEPEGSTTWVSFPAQSFDLGPTDSLDIPFTVSVPEDAAPGEYVTVLVAQTDGPIPIQGTSSFKQNIRSVIGVMITVPGATTSSFELGEPSFVSDGGNRLVIPIDNTGNVLIRPAGEFTIATEGGELLTEAPVAMQTVLASSSTTVEIALPDQFLPGDYSVEGTLTDTDSGATDSVSPTVIAFVEEVPEDEVPPQFTLDPVSISAVGDPVQFADVSVTIQNPGQEVRTGTIKLVVSKDGEQVEEYVFAQNQAMPTGESTLSQRYIPATGWESGTYTFEFVVSSIDQGGTETVIADIQAEDTIEIS